MFLCPIVLTFFNIYKNILSSNRLSIVYILHHKLLCLYNMFCTLLMCSRIYPWIHEIIKDIFNFWDKTILRVSNFVPTPQKLWETMGISDLSWWNCGPSFAFLHRRQWFTYVLRILPGKTEWRIIKRSTTVLFQNLDISLSSGQVPWDENVRALTKSSLLFWN